MGDTVCKLARLVRVVSHFGNRQRAMNMIRYTNAELVNIHFIYGLANENGRAAVPLYGERYSMQRQPNYQKFTRVLQNLAEHRFFSVTD